jgi:hypothetical protein
MSMLSFISQGSSGLLRQERMPSRLPPMTVFSLKLTELVLLIVEVPQEIC